MAPKNRSSITGVEKAIKQVANEYINRLTTALVKELNERWNEYMHYLRGLPESEQQKLKDYFKVESFDDIIIEEVARGYIKVIDGRVTDARRLEYVYGKRTPFSTILSKIQTPGGAEALMRKHGLL